jgi:hypothetical protein
MSTVEDIKQAVLELSATDLATFRAWFAVFDADVWDRQFDQDVAEGRLDALATEALQDLSAGRCTDL